MSEELHHAEGAPLLLSYRPIQKSVYVVAEIFLQVYKRYAISETVKVEYSVTYRVRQKVCKPLSKPRY